MLFGLEIRIVAMVALVGFAAAAVLYALFYGRLASAAQAEKRRDKIGTGPARQQAKPSEALSARRRTVQDTLKEIEVKQRYRASKTTNPPLSLRLVQAGLRTTPKGFFLLSALSGVSGLLLAFLLGAPPLIILGIAFVTAFGLPRFVVNFLRKRRMNAFTNELASAVEVIVRGVKAGLPLNDCLRMIATEAKEPVRSEFRQVVDELQIGLPIDEAITHLYERMPLPEANFLAIVISIQSKAGGSLSEALGNLAKVLRDRKKMKAKIKAMSSEAKSSAAIIGSLPIIVMVLVYITSPDYIMVLFVTPIGQVVLGCSALVMLIGIMVMKKMISFDF